MEDDVMAVGKTLTIFLNADLKKFNAGMAQAQGGLKGFAAGMKNLVGPAAIGAGIAIAGLATKMAVDGVKAAMENEESLVKLTNTLTNLGLAHNTQAIEDYIYQLERSFGVADTELRPAYQKLVVSTGNVADANKALGLALDVSASSGKSLEQVTEALSKAFSGQVAGLSRLNLGIDAATIRSGDMDLILQKLSETTAGAAAASADTLTGRMKVLQTAVDNLGEAFGQGLVNSLKKGTDGTNSAVKDMAELEEGLTDVGESIGDTGFAVAGFVIELNKINTAVNDAAKGNNVFSKALDTALTILNPVSMVTETLGNVMGFLSDQTEDAGDAIDETNNSANNAVTGWNNLSNAINNASMQTDDFIRRNSVKLKLIKLENLNYQDAAARANNLLNVTENLTETTKTYTGSKLTSTDATAELTKKEQKLIDKYKEGEIALTTRGQQLLEEVTALDAARTAITDYTSALSENILSGVNLGTAYEAQFNAEGQKTGASLLDGFNQQIAQAEYFGEVLNQIKAQGADQSLIEQIASLGPETGAALAQQMIDEGLVATLSDKWVSVNSTVNELAKGLIPEGLLAGEQFALATVQGTAATLLKEQKSLRKLGKQVGKIVGASFKAQLADDVAEAVRNVEAQRTAARAEAVAQAERQQVALTNQAVAQALQNLIRGADSRNGAPISPLLS